MKSGTTRRPGRTGFTLIELVTVVAILGILVTIVIGAFGGLKNYQASVATTEIMKTINTGLQQYYTDYNAYPWVDTTVAANSLLATQCGDFADGVHNKALVASVLPPTGATGVPVINQPAAVLYNALNTRSGHGAAAPGGAGVAMDKKVIGSTGSIVMTYKVYVDGWGRQIYYWPADLMITPPAALRNRVAADGTTPVTFVKPADFTYQCRLHPDQRSATPAACPTCGAFMSCPKGPVIESLGGMENDDGDNVVSWGSLTK
jgi:prepilin-type N-terminal cleavage/methylation domain-containing protein